ncbi:MAG: thioredoxin [Tyzzerella sp.]|nr:thioredoxin [Tyzzerella sp.]
MAEINVSKNNFEEEVLNAKGKVLVDFWASWCGPCKMLAPVLSEVAEEYADEIKVCKINVEDEMELAQKYRISSVPSLLVFENGEIVNQAVGFMPKEELAELWS